MQIPLLSIIFMFISAVVSIGTPVFLFIFFRRNFGARVLPLILGIVVFVIFVLVLEAQVHKIVFARYALRETPVLYVIYGIFMAGIFEETGRFIAFTILRRKYSGIGSGLSYGIGHGGAEAILLAGITMLIIFVASILVNTGNIEIITGRFQGEALAAIQSQIENVSGAAPYMFLLSGIERLAAIAIQLSLSVMVFYAVYRRSKIWLYPLAIVFHAIIDIPAAAMQAGLLSNVLLVEGMVCLAAIAIVFFAIFLHRKLSYYLAPIGLAPF